jgi:hypothetical protein
MLLSFQTLREKFLRHLLAEGRYGCELDSSNTLELRPLLLGLGKTPSQSNLKIRLLE